MFLFRRSPKKTSSHDNVQNIASSSSAIAETSLGVTNEGKQISLEEIAKEVDSDSTSFSFLNLPDEVLENVLSRLPRADKRNFGLVNKQNSQVLDQWKTVKANAFEELSKGIWPQSTLFAHNVQNDPYLLPEIIERSIDSPQGMMLYVLVMNVSSLQITRPIKSGYQGIRAIANALADPRSILHTLIIQNANLRNHGVAILAEALNANKTLTVLDLQRNFISQEGADALAKTLIESNKTLTSLNLDHNLVSMGALALSKALLSENNPSLKSLSLADNTLSYNNAYSIARAISGINSPSGPNTTLTYVSLAYNNIQHHLAAEAIGEMLKGPNKTLQTLDLTDTYIGSSGATNIAEALVTNTSLRTLILDKNLLQTIDIIKIANALQIATHSSLKKLSLEGNGMFEQGAREIGKMLRNPSLNLETLNLDGSIMSKGFVEIARAIKERCTLTYLNLNRTALDEDGVTSLAQALRGAAGKSLQTLYMYLFVPNSGSIAPIAKALADTKTTITDLDLSLNSISKNDVDYVAEMIRNNNTPLKRLKLSVNRIESSGAKMIADAIFANTSLHIFDINYNPIKDEGVIAIVNAVSATRRIKTLAISNTKISSKGWKAIFTAIRDPLCTLTYVDVSGNNMSKADVIDLAEALKRNTSLTSLNISNNNIEKKSADVIISTLRDYNKTLVHLTIEGNANEFSSNPIIPLLLARKSNF